MTNSSPADGQSLTPPRWDLTDVERSLPISKRTEKEARLIAANLGVPDLVYETDPEHVLGSSTEPADGLILSASGGLLVQMKTRESPNLDPQKVILWIQKHAKKGANQADGLRRRFAHGDVVTGRSVRGFERQIEGASDWPAIVILAVDGLPENFVLPARSNTLWMSASDWLHLHSYLPSARSIVDYAKAAISSEIEVPLGREQDRYFAIAKSHGAMAKKRVNAISPFPMTSLFDDDETLDVVPGLIEDAYKTYGLKPETPLSTYLHLVELLDGIALSFRQAMAEALQPLLREAFVKGSRESLLISPADQLSAICLMAAPQSSYATTADYVDELERLCSLRKEEAERRSGHTGETLGIGWLINASGDQHWPVFVIVNESALSPAARWDTVTEFGDRSTGALRQPMNVGRNERCLCWSGKKFKHCHGS